jgi:hypothetical protein
MKTMKLNIEMDPIANRGPACSHHSSGQPATQSKQAEASRGPAMPVWACGFFPLFPMGALKEGL